MIKTIFFFAAAIMIFSSQAQEVSDMEAPDSASLHPSPDSGSLYESNGGAVEDTVQPSLPNTAAIPDEGEGEGEAVEENPVQEGSSGENGSAESQGLPSVVPAQTAQAPVSDKPEAGSESGSEGFAFHPGLSFGTMTRNGQTWTRLSFRPDISIGKLGVALDLELFMNDRQQFDSYGWDFSTTENGMESLFRKIYYVRWAQPGDKLYLKAGSLDDITLGYGLIMKGYGNTALYPDRKLVGFHGQVNHISSLDINLEWVLNSFNELTQGKGTVGLRGSFAPMSGMMLPFINRLRFGATLVSDLDQYAALPDRDGDNCPDDLDLDPDNRRVCLGAPPFSDTLSSYDPDATLRQTLLRADHLDSVRSQKLRNNVKEGDQFSLISFDAGLPILSLPLISLEVYSELAFQMYQNSNSFFDGGYGLIFPGARAGLGPVRASLEYRMFKMPFHPAHFNAYYEAERAEICLGRILTKESKYWSTASMGSKGIYGSADIDLKKVVTVGGSYKMMFPEEGGNEEGYSGRAALGELITRFIPKVSSGELFWVKERVGKDLNSDGDPRSSDGFFDASIYTYFGYAVGVQVSPNMVVTISNITTYIRDENGKLQRQPNLALETSITF